MFKKKLVTTSPQQDNYYFLKSFLTLLHNKYRPIGKIEQKMKIINLVNVKIVNNLKWTDKKLFFVSRQFLI